MGNKDFYRIQNLIDGEWVEEKGVEYVPLYNPSTGETIGEVPRSGKETTLAAGEGRLSIGRPSGESPRRVWTRGRVLRTDTGAVRV